MNSIEKLGQGMTYGGGGSAILFGLDANTIGMLCGVLIGVAGLLITWYYQRRRDAREQEAHDQLMRREP